MHIRIIALWIGALALVLVVFSAQLLAPGETIQTSGVGNATILLSADHAMVAFPGACLNVSWQVEQIQAVYINGKPTIGRGAQSICVTETQMPDLRVIFKDGTRADYRLDVMFLTEQLSTWLLVGAWVLFALFCALLAISRPKVSAPSGPLVAPGTAGARRSPIGTIFALIGVLSLTILLTLVLLELGLRFYFTQFGTDGDRAAYVESRAEIQAHQTNTILLPFVETGLSPNIPGQNSLGYRGDEIQVPKPEGTYRIVVLGDSSTYGVFVGYDQTYAAQLQQILRSDGYPNVEVINGGVTGYTSWNILVDLALRIPVLEPDLVIFYEASNDVLTREVPPDCYNALSPFLGLDPRHILRGTPDELSPFTLYRFAAIQLGWMANPALNADDELPSAVSCGGQGGTDIAQNLAANSPTYLARNEREMAAIEQGNHVRMMFMTWAYDHNNTYEPPYWAPAVDENNEVTRQVAIETGSLLFDYAAVAPTTDDRYWNDADHMNVQGEHQLAQALADFLIAQTVIPKPGATS